MDPSRQPSAERAHALLVAGPPSSSALWRAVAPRLAAAVFLGAELTTLAAAHLAVASAIEPLSLVRPLWKPALAVGLSLLVGPALLGEAPVARAGLSLGLGVAGLLLFDRGLVARLARHILPGAR